MAARYIVRLSLDERKEFTCLVSKGKVAAYKRLHAQILLKADISEAGPGWSDSKIAETLDVSIRTVERLRKRLVEEGLEAALNRAKQKRVRSRRLDGEQEAHLIALTCGDPPDGYGRWTLRLLADRMVELKYTDTVSHETVRQVLKKRNKTVAEDRMVYSTGSERGICLCDGRYAFCL
jgi:transposase